MSILVSLSVAVAAPGATIFHAVLTPEQVVPSASACDPLIDLDCEPVPLPGGISRASGFATFSLQLAGAGAPFMEYEMTFSGLDLSSDVTGIHIHFGAAAANATIASPRIEPRHLPADAAGRHVLNVFGQPRQDDGDLQVYPEENRLTGRWDNHDQNLGPDGIPDVGDSIAVGSLLDEFYASKLYIQVHTTDYPAPFTAELRGQILPVPEPSTGCLVALSIAVMIRRRSR